MSLPLLDHDIEHLQARVSALKSQLNIQISTLLASAPTRQLIASDATPSGSDLLSRSASQEAHNQQCLYRVCAGLTTFRARDPDPNAVDGGAILGLRIEVVSRARFLRPYYVLLNRLSPGNGHLRVHRHTVPACVPLAALATRYLPSPSGGAKQDLARFAKALRRELARYHHRLGLVADLRKAVGLGKLRGENVAAGVRAGEEAEASTENKGELANIGAADADAKQISLEWADGRMGRLVMGDDGEVLKVVAVGDNGRDREVVRRLLGGATSVEDVVKKLAAGV